MKTFAVTGKSGVKRAFEIQNVYVSGRAIRRILSSLEGASNIRKLRWEAELEGSRMEFEYAGVAFLVWEPYGDNSRYWIGPKDDAVEPDPSIITEVEEAFRRYRPPFLRKIVGDLLSLDFKALFKRE